MKPEELLESLAYLDEDLLLDAMEPRASAEAAQFADATLCDAPLPAEESLLPLKKRFFHSAAFLRFAAAAAVFVLILAGFRFALRRQPKKPDSLDAPTETTAELPYGTAQTSKRTEENRTTAVSTAQNGAVSSSRAAETTRNEAVQELPGAAGPGRTTAPSAADGRTLPSVPGVSSTANRSASRQTSATAADRGNATNAAPTAAKTTAAGTPPQTAEPSRAPEASVKTTAPITQAPTVLPTESPTIKDADEPEPVMTGLSIMFGNGRYKTKELNTASLALHKHISAVPFSGSGSGTVQGDPQSPTVPTTDAPDAPSQPQSTAAFPEGGDSVNSVPSAVFYDYAGKILLQNYLSSRFSMEARTQAELERLYGGGFLPTVFPGTQTPPAPAETPHGVYLLPEQQTPVPFNSYFYQWTGDSGDAYAMLLYVLKDDGSFPGAALLSEADGDAVFYTALAKRGDTVFWMSLEGKCTKDEFLRLLRSAL